MQSWMGALARNLDVRMGEPVARVEAAGARATVLTSRESWEADAVVLAVEPRAVARILGLQAPPPPVAPVSIVAFGVEATAAPAEGYGILAPEKEGRFVLGCLYESALFPRRAPEGMALLRCFVGGRRHPERTRMADHELAEAAWNDLRSIGIVRGQPGFRSVQATSGIPQLELGHGQWMQALPQGGNVAVLGIGHTGVGLDQLAQEAKAVARPSQ
jgi:oxygen-dependent protoporphyrinogen oxidase